MKFLAFKSIIPDKKKSLTIRGAIVFAVILVVFVTNMFVTTEKAEAVLLDTAAQVQMSDPIASDSGVTYTVKWTTPSSTSAVKCLNIVFGNTATIAAKPTGMSTTSAVKTSVAGAGLTDGNWTLYNTTDGTLQYEYATGATPSTSATITITTNTITNPSGSSFYAQISTYSTLASHACSVLVDQSNVMAMQTMPGVAVTATVNPSLTLSLANDASAVNGSGTPGITTTATTIPFGTLTAGTGVIGAHTATVSTNAVNGYFLYIRETGTFNDGNGDTITDTTGTNAAPATFSGSSSVSAWGYITDNSQESQFTSNLWAKFTTSNLEVAKKTSAINADVTHVAYQAEASNTTPPGSYATTVTYTAVGSY